MTALRKLAAAMIAVAAVLATAPALGRPAGPSLSQSNLSVEAGSTATLIVSAPGSPRGARVVVRPDDGVQARVSGGGPGFWILDVGTAPSTSEALLTVQLVARNGRNLGFAQARITSRPRPSADAVVQAELIVDGGSLVEGPGLQALLTIANRGEQALGVGPLRALVPKGIVLRSRAPANLLLQPHRTLVVPIDVKTSESEAAIPGKHVIGVVVPVTSDLTRTQKRQTGGSADPRGWTATVVATKEVTLSLPGMGEIQGPLQIPSLLLLPGLLAVLARSAASNSARPRRDGEDPVARLAVVLSPGLWVVMIAASGALGVVYALLSDRNVLYGYTLRDLTCLSAGSVVAGGVVGAIEACREAARLRRATAPRFAADLTPVGLITQLARERQPLRMPSRLVGEQQLFELAEGASAGDVWACGGIEYSFAGGRDDKIAAAVRLAARDGDGEQLAKQAAAGSITLAWREFIEGAVRVGPPRLVSRDMLKGPLTEDAIVQEAA